MLQTQISEKVSSAEIYTKFRKKQIIYKNKYICNSEKLMHHFIWGGQNLF